MARSGALLLSRRKKLELGPDGRAYRIDRYKGRGGSGEVYKAIWRNQEVAAKVFFPFDQQRQLPGKPEDSAGAIAGFIKQSIRLQEREYRHLAQLSHPSIVPVLDSGAVQLTDSERRSLKERFAVDGVASLPVLITQYVDGDRLGKAIPRLSRERVFQVLLRLAEALEYLHLHKRCMHLDIASVNVLVRRDIENPVLIDFALCKNLDFELGLKPSDQTTLLVPTRLFPPLPANHPLMQMLKRERRATRELILKHAFPWLDLYQYGRLLDEIEPSCVAVLAERELQHLRHLRDQLTDGEQVSQWSERDLVPRVERLEPARSTVFGVPELTAPDVAERTISVPLTEGVPLTETVRRILETPSFRRLGLINQLSLAFFVYPGATISGSCTASIPTNSPGSS